MIMRAVIYETLLKHYPTYFVGQYKGKCKNIYLVIKFGEQSNSYVNSLGAFQYFEVMVYAPINSLVGLDETIDKVKDILSIIAEPTGDITEDFIDDKVEAVMRSIKFKLVRC